MTEIAGLWVCYRLLIPCVSLAVWREGERGKERASKGSIFFEGLGIYYSAFSSFIDRIGYTKVEGMIDVSLLEHTVRENLKETAPRVCAIFDPVKLVITNYEGNITTVYSTYDPNSKSGTEGGNRKTKSTINWVECNSCIDAEARLYDRLFACENPSAEEGDFRDLLNPNSLEIKTIKVEGSLRSELHAPVIKNGIAQENHYQLLKQGYFVVDPDTTADHLILNRTASLKDNWQK